MHTNDFDSYWPKSLKPSKVLRNKDSEISWQYSIHWQYKIKLLMAELPGQ